MSYIFKHLISNCLSFLCVGGPVFRYKKYQSANIFKVPNYSVF